MAANTANPQSFKPIMVDKDRHKGGGDYRQILAIGRPRTGKTTILHKFAKDWALANGEPAFALDYNAELFSRFYNPNRGDIFIAPYDRRSVPWSPLAELQSEPDCTRIAHCLAGDDTNNVDQLYITGCVEACFVLKQRGYKPTNRKLVEYLSGENIDEIVTVLGDVNQSMAVINHEINLERALNTGRRIADAIATLDEDAGCDSFSIQDYVQSDRGGAFMYAIAAPSDGNPGRNLTSIVASVYLDCMKVKHQYASDRTWFFIDEIGQYPAIHDLPDSLSLGYKLGIATVASVQSIHQVEAIYGHNRGDLLLASFDGKAMFEASDADTAEWQKRQSNQYQIELSPG